MKVHFIAIGGAVMHNLAIALKIKGVEVSGSDDAIKEPSKSRLARYGILPWQEGWFPEKIDSSIDAIILGMHARADNPELAEALRIGIKVYSFPEYIYHESINKTRVVIGGSHGKTSITAMIMHVLKHHNRNFDFMVGSQLEGFEAMVEIKDDNNLSILEGDEYLSSPLDPRPKFHLYKANIGLISGIAWDHINVFPTFEMYLEQFRIFAENIPSDGHLVYCKDDETLNELIAASSIKAGLHPYSLPQHAVNAGVTSLKEGKNSVELQIFGDHNLRNIEGAWKVLSLIGVSRHQFFDAISSFKGAARRLEKIYEDKMHIVYRDFAHSPSKLKATIEAICKQFPDKKVTAVMELHTFSSLSRDFLSEYRGSMAGATVRLVFYDPETVKNKKLAAVSIDNIKAGFDDQQMKVAISKDELTELLKKEAAEPGILLMMSSGNFSGIDFEEILKD